MVIDAKGDEYRAIAGDFVVGMAQTLGITGIIVDGTIRDIVGIKALDFPVFSRGTTVAASGKAGVGEINIPISCGGALVQPGDIVVGDADGIVVIPQVLELDVLAKASDKLEKDNNRAAYYSGNPNKIIQYLDDILGISDSPD